jgi:uncharacterized membrane protein
MGFWETARRASWSTRAVIAASALAVLLVAAVPVALLAGIILMLLGHVIGGLAVFGGSVLVAVAGVVTAGMSGVHHVRGLISRSIRLAQAAQSEQPAQPVIRLDEGEYHYS